jgi:protein-S-isoprenylcysteine O-methyltransferase Ste14
MGERESKVKDLEEKLKRGELTPKEVKKNLKERGLVGQESWKWRVSYLFIMIAYFVLCPMPLPLKSQLQRIPFPIVVIYGSLIPLGIGTLLAIWMHITHSKKGGLKGSDETVIFYRDSPYNVMRHPGIFGIMMWLIFLPIIISNYVPFTFLSVIGIILVIGYHYYMVYVEEKFNTMKWGDEYIQYMKEVPRFNAILVLGVIVVVAALWIWDYLALLLTGFIQA